MNEIQLLTFGCAVTFIGVAGAYVYLRERWLASHRAVQDQDRRSQKPQRVARQTV